jgi:hypothetical protein
MKTVGIVGGIAPESTIEYYRLIIASYRGKKQDGSYPENEASGDVGYFPGGDQEKGSNPHLNFFHFCNEVDLLPRCPIWEIIFLGSNVESLFAGLCLPSFPSHFSLTFFKVFHTF